MPWVSKASIDEAESYYIKYIHILDNINNNSKLEDKIFERIARINKYFDEKVKNNRQTTEKFVLF